MTSWPLAALLALGAVLRYWPLAGGGPVPHPDEFNATVWPLLVALGDPEPSVFYYPTLHTYILAAIHWLRALALAPTDMSAHTWLGVQYFWHEAETLHVARLVQFVCACVSLYLLAALAKTLYGERAGLIAAGLGAISLLAIRQSPIAGLDIPMAMWFVAAVLAASRLTPHSSVRAYAVAGVLVGVAASTKYHGAMAGVAVLTTHLAQGGSIWDRRLWLAGVGAVAAFVVGSPYTVLTPVAFIEGFSGLVEHASTGLGDQGPGWIHHLLLSLRINLGWAGLTALVVGLWLSFRGSAAARAAAMTFVVFYLVIGASPLVFTRYAMPLALLQCVLVAGALERLFARIRHAWVGIVALALIAGPTVIDSWRVAHILAAPDTRQQAVDYIERHVPAGATMCNFGSWSADPPLRTVEGTWWLTRRFVQRQSAQAFEAMVPSLTDPRRPAYSYAIQPDRQSLEPGSVQAVEEFACDYILTNSHPLSPVRLDSAFTRELPTIAKRLQRWQPDGWPSVASAQYDPIDAFYVPMARFSGLQQPGPTVELWEVRGARSAAWPSGGERLLAAAIRRGALSAYSSGSETDFVHLSAWADQIHPASAENPDFLRRVGWVQRRLGNPEAAARTWQRALQTDPDDARLWWQLGLLAAGGAGDEALARHSMQRALDLQPAHPNADRMRSFLRNVR